MEGFIGAICPLNNTIDLYTRLFNFANTTLPRYPLTDWYDANTAAYVGFSARAQVGGLFSTVWMNDLLQKKFKNHKRI